MSKDLSLALRLSADAARFVAGMTQAGSSTRKFVSAARKEFDALKGMLGSVHGQIAALGVSFGALAALRASAGLDKGLTRIRQDAALTRVETDAMRASIMAMSGKTGSAVDDLASSFDRALNAGHDFGKAKVIIDSVNDAVAVLGGTTDALTESLLDVGREFKVEPEKYREMIDKLRAGGKLGKSNTNEMTAIMADAGGKGAAAGMNFDQMVGFSAMMSNTEKNLQKRRAVINKTLSIFTDKDARAQVAQATGVKFWGKDNKRRDPMEVLADIKKKYDAQKDDKARERFMFKTFGNLSDVEAKGMRELFDKDGIAKAREFSRQLQGASGTIARELPEALANAGDQTARLKAKLGEAADSFAQPINETLQNVIRWGLDKKENGGLELSGGEILAGGTGLALGGSLLARYGGKAIGKGWGKFMSKFGGTAAGVAEGKALEAAAGVTPVFVVNWPGTLGGGIPDAPKIVDQYGKPLPNVGKPEIPGVGKTGLVTTAVAAGKAALAAPSMGAIIAGGAATTAAAAGLVAAVGAASYAAGSWFNDKFVEGTDFSDKLGRAITRVMADLGSEKARDALDAENRARETEVGGKVTVELIGGSVASIRTTSTNPNVPLDVSNGYYMGLSN